MVLRDVGLQFALMTEILDPKAQKRQVEEKIKAAEEWNNLFLENAARIDIHCYMQKELQMAGKTTSNSSASQLSLRFKNDAVSAGVNPRYLRERR
jgi:hypothetical protein